MKKWIIAGMTLLFALAVTACGSRESGTDIPQSEESGFMEEYSQELMEEEDEEDYGLDLSLYDAHGEWSYDRMWVHKTEESWDGVRGYYSYIDREGNLICEWHEEKTNENSFESEEFTSYRLETAPWELPGDFQGEYAAVLCGKHGSTAEISYVEIMDTSGRSVGRFEPNFSVYSYNSDEGMLNDFAGRLSAGVLFWDRDRFETSMSWIENGELYIKDIDDYSRSAYCIQDKINGYYPYLHYYEESRFGLIDINGNIVFQGEMDYEVTELIPSDESETVSVYFIGKDERTYVVEMDFDGNWLTEPERADD